MNLVERALFLAMAMAVFQMSIAAVYKVGDSAGWTTIGNVDYKQWAASKSFLLGDIIIFEYNAQFHNVMRVKHGEYRACNTTSPIATYSTGNDSITITTRGHHFFFCGVPGHCQTGQKVDINVPRLLAMAPTPSASPVSPPSVLTTADVPGPNPSKTAPLNYPFSMLIGFVVVFAVYVSGFV